MTSTAPAIDIGIPADQRAGIAEALGRLLADSTVLYAKTHGFHWNVTGPMFNTLHLMFMQQYTELWTALDEIAERIRALGHPAPFGYRRIAELSSIPESTEVPNWCRATRRWCARPGRSCPWPRRPRTAPVPT